MAGVSVPVGEAAKLSGECDTRYDHTAVLTLALDTTTKAGSVAVVRDTLVLAVVYGDITRTHGERLPSEIAQAQEQAGISIHDVELLVVASGPGAFTGLRIGLAAIQGIAMVTGCPAIAVSALDALALAAATTRDRAPSTAGPLPPWISAWMDAQRGEVFAASYASADIDAAPAPVTVPIVAKPELAIRSIPEGESALFIGDGALRYEAQIVAQPHVGHCILPAPAALAPYLASIGISRARLGAAGPPHALQPLYVRRSDAELARQQPEAR
jgi:tRNA threonylcarbamoyladenosine biosynthesis protein TsaB